MIRLLIGFILISTSSCAVEPDNSPKFEKNVVFESTHTDGGANLKAVEDFNNDGKDDILITYQEGYRSYTLLQSNEEEKMIFLDNYFSVLDPDTTTVKNESLEELNRRVAISEKLFSNSDRGIFSDRARIYIIYGTPENEYENKKNNSNYLIWQYTIDNKLVEFQFINDSFGHYKLIIDEFKYINN